MIPFALILGSYWPDATDRAFIEAQTRVLIAFHGESNAESLIPAAHANAIRSLGCAHFDCRETADVFLGSLDYRAIPALTIGTTVPVAEVRERCVSILTRLGRCDQCFGSGACANLRVHILTKDRWSIYPWWTHACKVCSSRTAIDPEAMHPVPHPCWRCDGVGWHDRPRGIHL